MNFWEQLGTLNEKYLTFFDDRDSKLLYIDKVWDILEKSYASIGGWSKSKEEILNDGYIWKLVRRGDKITAAVIYKNYMGRKLIGAGSDGTESGKKDLYSILKEDISEIGRGVFGEYSEALEHIVGNKLGAKPIPVDVAEMILNDMNKDIISKDPDGFHYTRYINGRLLKKIMYGNFGGQK